MRKSILTALSVASLALVLTATTASAQAAGRRAGAGPDAAARREAIDARREARKARVEALTPAQREAMKANAKAYGDLRKSLMQQVKAGKIDRKNAAEQLKAWREANRPAKP